MLRILDKAILELTTGRIDQISVEETVKHRYEYTFADACYKYRYTIGIGAVGIIGGADTPTYEFVVFRVMDGWPFVAILFGITLIFSALFCLLFSKTVINNCNMKTTVLSLGLSAVGAAGLVCVCIWFVTVAFGEISKYPIKYPASVLLGSLCFFAFVVLLDFCQIYHTLLQL